MLQFARQIQHLVLSHDEYFNNVFLMYILKWINFRVEVISRTPNFKLNFRKKVEIKKDFCQLDPLLLYL